MAIAWRPFVDLVNEHQSFVLTTHMRPDCDALGSELALAAALEALGKQVRIVNADGVPPHIAFIDRSNRVEVLGEDVLPSDLLGDAVDAMIVVDTSAWQQIGPMGDVLRESTAAKVVIDHHVSGDDLGAQVFKDDSAEANGRLVLEAIEALGVAVTEEMATALFAAIATDTGWFRFASVGPSTFAAIEKLVAAGASPTRAFAALYERNTKSRVQLHGRILTNIQTEFGERFAHASASRADFEATGAELNDTEDVVNRLLSIEGGEASSLFVELEQGITKVSLRSRADFDVRSVAEQFGGGGHRAAAGVRINEPLDEARKLVLDAIDAKMKES
ncbi:MAG: DHH family phosphoesterase [Aeoliella sp.]